jgi:hypothetical protein
MIQLQQQMKKLFLSLSTLTTRRYILVAGSVIELSSFQGTQQRRCLPPLAWGRKYIQFSETLCFLVFRIPDDGKSPKTQ